MKKLLLSLVCGVLGGAMLFAETDGGTFLPSAQPFAAENIYVESNAGIVFPLYVFKDKVKGITKPSGGFSFGAGYNWDGWLFGLEYTRDYFGSPKKKGKTDFSHVSDIRANVISFRLRRVIAQDTFRWLPGWLEIVPGVSAGVNFFTMKDSINDDVDFGNGYSAFGRASLEIALIPGTDRASPYAGVDYDLFTSKKHFNGVVGYARGVLGFRLYPFGKNPVKAASAVSVVSKIAPANGFTPDGNGVNDTIDIKTSVKKLKDAPESWKVEVRDQQNDTLKTWTGKGNVPTLTWDGKTDNGDKLFSSETYTVVTTVVPTASDRARIGEETVTSTATFKTGVLMEEIIPQKQWKIVVNTIYFDANAATFDKLSDEQKVSNKETLDSIAKQALALSEDIKIEVQGYANNVSNTEEEDKNELIPLSKDRAESIAKQLRRRGLKEDNLTAVGKGGANPLAAWEDRAHWWKNRRVEFIVTK